MIKNKIILLLIILTSCSFMPQDEKEMVRVRGKFASEQEKKYDLKISGLGAAMFDQIREIKVYFTCDRQMTLIEARKLFISNVEDLIKSVNSDIRIKQYLFQNRFSYENADIRISFLDKNYHYHSPPYIAFITSIKGKIYYCQNDPVTDFFIDFHQETIQEAIQILKEQDKLIENNI